MVGGEALVPAPSMLEKAWRGFDATRRERHRWYCYVAKYRRLCRVESTVKQRLRNATDALSELSVLVIPTCSPSSLAGHWCPHRLQWAGRSLDGPLAGARGA